MRLKHIQYIIDHYSTQLQQRLQGEGKNINVENAMDTLLACDPSQGKKLVDWLVKTYIAKGFKWEDVEIRAESKLAEVLGLYLTNFHQIYRDQRDIYLCKSYGQLCRLIEPYIYDKTDKAKNSLGSQEIKRRERARALEESEVLYRSDDIIVSVPLTEEASKWWGRGTKWCTAAEKNNYFSQYNQHAPLIVITLLNPDLPLRNNYSSGNESSSLRNENFSKGGAEKFQIWGNDDDLQFMDAQDCEVDDETIEKYWNYFKPVLALMIKQNGHFLNYMPQQFRTIDLCTRAIEQSGYFLRFTPDAIKTKELCCLAVKNYGNALLYVPAKLMDYKICRLAVEQNGRSLGIVPQKLRTAELCKRAVEQNGYAISYVPGQLKTVDLCKLAVSVTPESLKLIPEQIKAIDHSFYSIAVEQNPLLLFHVPEALRTNQMCCAAVEKDGRSIAYVPEKYQTDLLREQAVKQNGLALGGIKIEWRTLELCRMAIEQKISAQIYIPEQFEDEEFELLSKPVESVKVSVDKKWDQAILTELKESLTNAFSKSLLNSELPFTQ